MMRTRSSPGSVCVAQPTATSAANSDDIAMPRLLKSAFTCPHWISTAAPITGHDRGRLRKSVTIGPIALLRHWTTRPGNDLI